MIRLYNVDISYFNYLFQKKNNAQIILNENYFNWLKVMTDKCGSSKDQQIRSCFLHTQLYHSNMTVASPSNYLFPTSFKKIIGHKTPNISVSIYIHTHIFVLIEIRTIDHR